MNASGLVTPCCLRLGGMKTVLCFVRTLVLVNKLELIRKNETYSSSYLQLHGKKILQLLEELFAWLPIGTIVDNEVLVIHGGISESTDLNLLYSIKRNKVRKIFT